MPGLPSFDSSTFPISRRSLICGGLGTVAAVTFGGTASAARTSGFARWVAAMRPRAIARGVSPATYARVTDGLTPDLTVLDSLHAQPEFPQKLWQYINRCCSEWRVTTGKERAHEHAALLRRVERDYGVDRYLLLALWGMESSFGDVIDNPKYMRPVIPALAALAWRDPRRRRYWESEFINALVIVDRGWSKPADMIGSWAGAMGHTQWMPEVWLHMGVDYNRDGRINPFGDPADALAGTARFLVERGHYRRGEAWGHEVTIPVQHIWLADNRHWRTYEEWHAFGIRRADEKSFSRLRDRAKLWLPERGGPAFLVGANFRAVYAYNPSTSYSLSLVHLGDLIRGDPPFHRQFPGGERVPTFAEVKEIQRRLNQHGFKTDGIDGRSGSDTVKAVAAFQRKVGMHPADGYPGLKVLARLRQST